MKRTIFKVMAIAVLILTGCSPDEKIENGCECELITVIDYVYTDSNGTLHVGRRETAQPYTDDCDLDGLILTDKTFVRCQ